MNQARRPLVRSATAVAVGLLLLAEVPHARAVPLVFFASVQTTRAVQPGGVTIGSDQNTGDAPVNAVFNDSTASSGTGLLTASASARAGRTGVSTAFLETSQAQARILWTGPALDPFEAGTLARLTFTATGLNEGTVSGLASTTAFHNFSIRSRSESLFAQSSLAVLCNPVCSETSSALNPASGVLLIQGGQQFELSVRAEARPEASGPLNGTSSSSAKASISLSYTLEVFEDRRHWNLPGTGALVDAESWVERAAPDATSWAAFNSGSGRTLALTLPGSREWRGLIVDGESLSLNLSSQTLTLGDSGPSQKTFSIRVGEGRRNASSLTLRNGTVLASNDVLVGGVFGSTGPTGSLTVDTGAVLDQTGFVGLGSMIVGDKGPGTLVVRGGLSGGGLIKTNVLALARNAPGNGDAGPLRSTLEITGDGSRVEAVLVSLADRGEATATVKDGGVLQTQSLDMANKRDARATLTIDGAGSKLVMNGAFADVGTGAGGRATLEVLNGALIEGNNSVFRVGSGKPEDFSVLRIKGSGSLMNDAGVIVQTGGLLEVRDGARWAGNGSLLEVRGGEANFNTGTAKLTDLIVAGQFSGESLVSTGQVNIDNGSVIDASGADLVVGSGGRMSLTGGSRVFGFSSMLVNGSLTVNSGTTLEGNTLGLSAEGALRGTGTIKVNTRFTAEGQLNPGNSPGILRIEGDVLLTDTAELVLEVAGTAAGTQYDVLEVLGGLTLQGGRVTLAFIDGFAPLQGQEFVLLDVSGSFQSTASFSVSGLEDGWQFSTGFDPSTGQLTLTSLSNGVSAVPEPAAWLLWCVGLAGWLARRRFN